MIETAMRKLHACKALLPAAIVVMTLLASMTLSAPRHDEKVLRHVVIFRFKEATSPEDVKKIENAFRALPVKIHEIRSFEWGTNVSPEHLNQGYTHCFLLTFASDKDRDAYLVHPAHKEFGNIIGSALDKVFVLDFWAQK